MSVTIYHGIRFPDADLASATRQLQTLRPTLEQIVRDRVAALLAAWIADAIDWDATGRPPGEAPRGADADQLTTHPMAAAWMHLLTRAAAVERTRVRDPEVDFECTVRLLPTANGVLGVYATEQDALAAALLAAPGIVPWGYWDNTDPDETVPAAEWAARERDWMALVRQGHGSLRDLGPLVTLTDRLTVTLAAPSPAEVAAHLPSHAARAQRRARMRVLNQRCAAREPSADPGAVFQRFYEAVRWLETADGVAALAAEGRRMAALLPVTITEAQLADGLHAEAAAAIPPACPATARGNRRP